MIMQLDKIPFPGETLIGNQFSTAPGGKGANQAVAAARLGGNVSFVGCVGNDQLGDSATDILKNESLNGLKEKFKKVFATLFFSIILLIFVI